MNSTIQFIFQIMKNDSISTGSCQVPVPFLSSSGAAMNPGTHPLYYYSIENSYEPF